MHRTEATERDVDPGAPERRLAAAEKQLRIVREDVEDVEDAGHVRGDVGGRVDAAIHEVEAARELLE